MSTIRQLRTGLWVLLAMTVITGLLYPLAIWGFGQVALADQANGSLIERDGKVVASKNIGQNFQGDQWFHPRPSAAGDNGYDGLSSSGTNYGPENPDLIESIKKARAEIAKENGVDPSQVPPDAVTSSSSGLDPHISPAYAEIQIQRVADARSLDPKEVGTLVDEHTEGPMWGFLGERVVNVVELNLALEETQ